MHRRHFFPDLGEGPRVFDFPTRQEPPRDDQPTLETRPPPAYPHLMEKPSATAPAPGGWRESLERSQAQIAAGQSVPLLPVLDRLRATAERIEAQQGVTEDGEGPNPRL
jgi:hypothetical protein